MLVHKYFFNLVSLGPTEKVPWINCGSFSLLDCICLIVPYIVPWFLVGGKILSGPDRELPTVTIYSSSISLILKKDGFFGSENLANTTDPPVTVRGSAHGLAALFLEEKLSVRSTDVINSTMTAESSSSDQQIGLIMTLSMSFCGILLLIFGFIRDLNSLGLSRLVMYVLISLTYLLLAIAEPNSSDYFQESLEI